MLGYNERFTDGWQFLGKIYGDAVAAATEKNSGYVSLATIHRVVIIIHPVDVNDALDVDIEQGTDTSGSDAKSLHSNQFDITVATTDTGPSVIEIQSENLDVKNGFKTLNVEVTTANTGGGGNEYAVEIWGVPRYLPPDTTLLDSVTDITS